MNELAPAPAERRASRPRLIHWLATLTVAFVWCWHGLVPKLLGPHPSELALLADTGMQEPWVTRLTLAAGWIELAFGLAFPFISKWRWPWLLTIALMTLATVGIVATSPDKTLTAFNPITLNLQVIAVATIGLLSLRDRSSQTSIESFQ